MLQYQSVVHIKTKIPAKKVSNDLPRSVGNLMTGSINFLILAQLLSRNKELQAVGYYQ